MNLLRLNTLKPWTSGDASRRKLKIWVYLRRRFACTCVDLRSLWSRSQICTQVKASFSPFGHPNQVNASWVTPINPSLANELDLEKTCVYLRGNLWTRLATKGKSLRMFNLRLLVTTCWSVWPGLKRYQNKHPCHVGVSHLGGYFSCEFILFSFPLRMNWSNTTITLMFVYN